MVGYSQRDHSNEFGRQTMVSQDVFVGLVALATGLFVFVSAVLNTQWANNFWIARHIENSSNASVSRFVLIAIGALCVLLGALLLLGFFPSGEKKTAELLHPHPIQESLLLARN